MQEEALRLFSETLSVSITFQARVAYVMLSGLLTGGALSGLLSDLVDTLQGARAVIARLDQVAIVVGELRFERELLTIPGAIVASPANLCAAQCYAESMRRRGVNRQAFSSMRAAETWIAAEVRLRQEQAAWRQRLSLP